LYLLIVVDDNFKLTGYSSRVEFLVIRVRSEMPCCDLVLGVPVDLIEDESDLITATLNEEADVAGVVEERIKETITQSRSFRDDNQLPVSPNKLKLGMMKNLTDERHSLSLLDLISPL